MNNGSANLDTLPFVPYNKSQDLIFAVGILVILSLLFLPMPAWLIDIGLAFSIAVSVLVLMVSLWITKPLDFSSFPTILLVVTMLRLSLNVSTTRLILTDGNLGQDAAGGVISGFASFVMGGDFVIGVVVFVILITVNFIVITKGASRIAEVSARFTLDSIPGKQMAIDADLAAGLLDEREAQTRRLEIEEESSFFGSMDGASKFVRGDAIAGLLITAINIVGGIIIGTWRHGMDVASAMDVYTRLSVGDGLVSQIPALVVSLGSGMLVSKVGSRESADKQVFGQMFNYPKALFVSAALLTFLAVTPGLPFFPFVLLAVATASVGILLPRQKAEHERQLTEQKQMQEEREIAEQSDTVQTALHLPEIEIVLGRRLAAKLLPMRNEVGLRIGKMRKRFASQYGFVIPEIKLSDSLSNSGGSYEIKIFGTSVAMHELSIGDVMVLAGSKPLPPEIPFEESTDPAFRVKAWKVPDLFRAQLQQEGFEVIDPLSELLTHLSEVLKNNLAQLFSYRDIRRLIDQLDGEYTRLIEEICPAHLTYSGLQAVFKALLAERVSIRNVTQILEAIAEVAPYTKRSDQLVEHVRAKLGHQICGDLAEAGVLKLIRIGDEWEECFNAALVRDARGEFTEFKMSSGDLERFGVAVRSAIEENQQTSNSFAFVTAPELRKYVRMVVERLAPTIAVLSNIEISKGIEIKVLGSVAN